MFRNQFKKKIWVYPNPHHQPDKQQKYARVYNHNTNTNPSSFWSQDEMQLFVQLLLSVSTSAFFVHLISKEVTLLSRNVNMWNLSAATVAEHPIKIENDTNVDGSTVKLTVNIFRQPKLELSLQAASSVL